MECSLATGPALVEVAFGIEKTEFGMFHLLLFSTHR
jgi:hypothetical protein